MIKVEANNIISAPSNIALIKYMGLSDADKKLPLNPSLSYTLNDIRTFIEFVKSPVDIIEAPVGQARFLEFYLFLKKKFNIESCFHLRSYNNFPASCGLASSASSFAALTATMAYIAGNKDFESIAKISRFGSGSSCRSFFSNFVTWSGSEVFKEDLPEKNLEHLVLLINRNPKKVSSSMAHKMVRTSRFYKDRSQNVHARFNLLQQLIRENSWNDAGEVIKEEYIEMHNLFETAVPEFSYRTEFGKKVESWFGSYKKTFGVVPWVTLDAGPNIHLLFDSLQNKVHCKNELTKVFPGLEILDAG